MLSILFGSINRKLGMEKLTSITIGAEAGLMKLNTWLRLKVGRDMPLLDELMCSMSEGASIFEMTLPSELPIPTHFSLQLRLV